MLSALLLLSLTGATALVPASAPVVTRGVAARRMPMLQMNARYDDPILDESLPDPVYDNTEPYKGNVPYGFSTKAERLNGRAAMTGFTILYIQELIAGKGVLEQYGCPPHWFEHIRGSGGQPGPPSDVCVPFAHSLPYDEGAQLIEGGTGIPGLVALAISTVIVGAGSYAGLVGGKALSKK